ncbi:MAG TPA: hypothetical protein PJ982_00780, partial [Lacipirellulaceae bacterium]|nr:hypothetical protein [Lacipirellulaceae bacterium]
ESLHRWKAVSVHYWSAWRDHKNGTWTDTEAVGIIEYFKIADGRRHRASSEQAAQSRFVWNRELFKSFQAGYLKPLDFGFYRSLKRPAAQRAYRFLDKRFHHQPEWEFDLRTFACEKLGFSRNYDTGQLKARLTPAMVELERAGYIKPVSFRKVRPKTWTVSVSQNIVKQTTPPAILIDSSSLAQRLVERGVAKSTAASLSRDYPAARIEEKLAIFDWLVARRDKRVSTNAPGFLVAAIRKDYAPPKDFRKSTPTKLPLPLREPKPVKSVPGIESVGVIEAYLAKLTAEQRADLEQTAVAAADPLTAEGYRRTRSAGGPTFAAYQKIVLRHYLMTRLGLTA